MGATDAHAERLLMTVAAMTGGYCESSAEKTSIGRPGMNITSGI